MICPSNESNVKVLIAALARIGLPGGQPTPAERLLPGYTRGVTFLVDFVPDQLDSLSNVARAVSDLTDDSEIILRSWHGEDEDPADPDAAPSLFFDLLWRAPMSAEEIASCLNAIVSLPA
jgi:hypothetical protein